MQVVLGIFFFASGLLMVMKYAGRDLAPFIPEAVLLRVVAAGSLVGGFYLIVSKLFKPRFYV